MEQEFTNDQIREALNKKECPRCKSKHLKDLSSFLIEGTKCLDCGWSVMDGGIA